MATSYKTPGVYIEEITKFPPSVAQVETAIPAFVGYTERAIVDGEDYHAESIVRPIKIGSLPDYEFLFGDGPDPTTIEIDLKADNSVQSATVNGVNLLYDAVRMFYANGGGDCYIVSVGNYNSIPGDVDKQELLDGLATLEKVDRPTLLVIPETVHLSESESGEVHAAMLSQCNKLQDRFAVLDIVNGDKEATPTTDPVEEFRNNVGMNYLKYGATYYPWLKTTLPFKISYDAIVGGTYTKEGSPLAGSVDALFNSEIVTAIGNKDTDITAADGFVTTNEPALPGTSTRPTLVTYATGIFNYMKAFNDLTFSDSDAADANSSAGIHARYIAEGGVFHGLLKTFYDYVHFSDADNSDAPSPTWDDPILDTAAASGFNPDEEFGPLTFTTIPSTAGNDIFEATSTAAGAMPFFEILVGKMTALANEFAAELKASRASTTETLSEVDAVYRGITEAISQKGVILPPSGAMVGIYAAVDNDRGVWKAPANVSVTAVKGPTVNITHEDQENLNVDVVAGKSVNAIRSFTGKGTLVWGARTLAGNDNEWRYVPVRRFFNMVEESVKKASEQFVFEPNDANTWVRIKAMITNFLTLQWKDGALAGPTPDKAFYVKVGLGETMTSQDILEGRMNIEIGMAAVRPAEFIILKFSHKMQEA